MSRRYSADEVAAALRRIGFALEGQRGSHQRYSGHWRGRTRYVTLVARQKEVPDPTLAHILRQAGITKSELQPMMKGEEISE